MNEVEYWHFLKEDIRESAIDMRDKSAVNFHKKVLSDDKKFNEWVYDFRYDCLKLAQKIIGKNIFGTVVEIGAGTGIYSCILSKNKEVKKIYAVDYSKVCVEELITFIIKRFQLSEEQEQKIIPVVGSFDEIKLSDESVDFIIAMGSLHHSENREHTLNEIYRVLKVGGYLIACERASYNTKTNKELNDALDKEYDAHLKKLMGYDANQKYTRRMNSEHEPLLAEWEYLLAKCGFQNKVFWFLKIPIGDKYRKFTIIWNALSKLLFKIIGSKLVKRKVTNIFHMKIPYYPWFSKSNTPDDILIISKKLHYMRMP